MKKRANNNITENQFLQALLALEEIDWILNSNKGKALLQSFSKIIESLRNNQVSLSINKGNVSKQDIRALLGVLPEFFQNTKLFRTNSDIEQFAREVLGVTILNYDKKSRNEIIGVIVCSVPNFEDNTFKILGQHLSELIDDEKKCNQIIKAKETTNFSWNDTIRKLFNS